MNIHSYILNNYLSAYVYVYMIGHRFLEFVPEDLSPFDKLFDLFKQLLTYTSGK